MLKRFSGWLVHVNPSRQSFITSHFSSRGHEKCAISLSPLHGGVSLLIWGPGAVGHQRQFDTREKQRFHPDTSFQLPLLHISMEADRTAQGLRNFVVEGRGK